MVAPLPAAGPGGATSCRISDAAIRPRTRARVARQACGPQAAGRRPQTAVRAMGAPAVDAIERNHRKWHGKQVKKGIKKANARKRVEKRAKKELRKTTKGAIVKTLFRVTKESD